MIDFRYHLVSLISVFLALAVGIVLGAGPLKETIGDTLTGEVDALRSRAADLRTELDGTQADLARSEQVFAAVAPDLLEGVLSQRRVAVLTVGDVELSVVEGVIERLGQAGAQVTVTAGVTEAWTDPTRRSYRQSLAGTLVEYLDPVPDQTSGTPVELAEALIQSLTTADPADPGAFTEDARIVLGVLTESGLVATEGEILVPADGIVVLVEPAVIELSDEGTPEPVDPDVAAYRESVVSTAVQIATAAQVRSRGAVVASGEVVEGGIFDRLRDTTRMVRISTVESFDSVVGQVSTVLALSVRMSGAVGHYGSAPSATDLVPPRLVLTPIDRTPAMPLTPDAEGEGTEASGDLTEGEA